MHKLLRSRPFAPTCSGPSPYSTTTRTPNSNLESPHSSGTCTPHSTPRSNSNQRFCIMPINTRFNSQTDPRSNGTLGSVPQRFCMQLHSESGYYFFLPSNMLVHVLQPAMPTKCRLQGTSFCRRSVGAAIILHVLSILLFRQPLLADTSLDVANPRALCEQRPRLEPGVEVALDSQAPVLEAMELVSPSTSASQLLACDTIASLPSCPSVARLSYNPFTETPSLP